jgi:signal transduction histidine kinase
VQEALTNSARHAPGAVTQVVLTYGPGSTTVQVNNTRSRADGDAAAQIPSATMSGLGGGNGLVGLRERLQRVGGTIEAGPTDDGWRVSLTVPTSRVPT